jgi:hypothetical protein
MNSLSLLPLTAATWGDWQFEKFCGHSLNMIAEEEGDNVTQESCLEFCQ